MKKFSANYTNSNHNFVIQNLSDKKIDFDYYPALCILKNILQRGKPTLMSSFLQDKLGAIHKSDEFKNPIAFISKKQTKWERIIRGDIKGNYFPAQKFYEELIPKYFKEYSFIQKLIIPEVLIEDITKVPVDEFKGEQVDFYLPQAYLIIEIDGSQHSKNTNKDIIRDRHTKKHGIATVRISTNDLNEENEFFLKGIQQIKERIKKVSDQQTERRKKDKNFISIDNYKHNYQSKTILNNPFYKASATIRFQLLIIELLMNGKLNLEKDWKIEILNKDVVNYEKNAIEDIFIWLKNLLQLHKIPFSQPKYEIIQLKKQQHFSDSSETIKINFSLLERYTDEFQSNPEIHFIRTDYFDEFLYFKKGNSAFKNKFVSFEDYDYFSLSTTDTIRYNLKFGGDNQDEKALLYLLWNVFLQSDDSKKFKDIHFREGQIPIIANALSKNDTIGLLPTGSGKSICYQLAAILQPAVSFVVCPIKSLMYDQKTDLDKAYFTRTNHVTSNDDGEDKEKIQREFGKGKYFFIFISPERFQSKTFRQYIHNVSHQFKFGYAVIDEVHCLSEWGHDFRTSYLNLSTAINKYCSSFNFIGLTATASLNVLKDIKIEFDIEEKDVKTPMNFTRKELEFIVVDDKNDKRSAIDKIIYSLNKDENVLNSDNLPLKCGIVFTPTVNNKNGCYPLANYLSEKFSTKVEYFSGSIPKIDKKEIMSFHEFETHKTNVQTSFKEDNTNLLTATKAFGMGVNKGNVFYTIHYGIPMSMESLYQEAGRAGRDKTLFQNTQAKCYILLSKTNENNDLKKLWEQKTKLSTIKDLLKNINGDINTNMFLFTKDLGTIEDEFEIIKKLYDSYASPGAKDVQINGAKINLKKSQAEKAIYRLKQIGVVSDWTISNFFGGGKFEVDFMDFSDTSIKESLIQTISKYDTEFVFEDLLTENKYSLYKKILEKAPSSYSWLDKCILILLQWSYDKFVYNRRQSLKNIYEACCKFSDSNLNSLTFKATLENYFKFSEVSFILQDIAEHPKNIQNWFKVFYKTDVKNELLDIKKMRALSDNLSRFLESYMNNTGLDYVSGIVRLFNGEYDNSDGRHRLESSIEKIKHFSSKEKKFIVKSTLKLARNFKEKEKAQFSETVYEVFKSNKILTILANELGDNFSIEKLVANANIRLNKINQLIYGKLREIEQHDK
ncbi:MAG: haloacid dehalogenase [Flavobacteriales bacterium]|nr:haloacid dehalogenase [Flavobacteriales bacterium]|tara:strand:+ start:11558 stop:15088 length:3531 start_codon:yes stop_codon:yes gene_type:complete